MQPSLVLLLLLGLAGNPAPNFKPNGAESSPKDIPYPSEWAVISGEYSAQPTENAKLTFTYTLETKNRVWIYAKVNNEIVVHHHWAEFRLKPSAAPSEFDFRDRKGIYTFDGETLKVCFAGPGKPRPKSFRTVAGDEGLLLILKRKKPVDPD